jgi:hypothetical protein
MPLCTRVEEGHECDAEVIELHKDTVIVSLDTTERAGINWRYLLGRSDDEKLSNKCGLKLKDTIRVKVTRITPLSCGRRIDVRQLPSPTSTAKPASLPCRTGVVRYAE